MEKKKLLVTASTFPRWEGDTEPRFILDLSKSLKEYFEVTVLAPACPGAKMRERIEDVEVIRYHYFPIHKCETLCYPGAIVPRIKEKKVRIFLVPFLFLGLGIKLFQICRYFDVVHAHWLIPQGIVQSFFNIPYIITGHGGDVSSLNFNPVKNLKVNCLKKAKEVIVVSNELKSQLGKYYDVEKVSVISMGCDTTKFSPKNREENYFKQNGKQVILFVGRLAEKKGVKYLVEASKDIDAKLIIVGDGPLRGELELQAEEQGDKIIFLGAKNHDELVKIFASADVFVAPSITAKDGDKEGLPTTIIEAMASGLPVVGTDSGGIKEIIIDGENGFVVSEKSADEIANAIKKILSDKNLRLQMSERALETAKAYDYKEKAKQYAELINRAICK